MGEKMKIAVITLLFICFMSCLMAFEMPKMKASANLGVLNGATLGFCFSGHGVKNQEHFINLDYYYHDRLRAAGLNYEIRLLKKRFYGLLEMGVCFGELAPSEAHSWYDQSESVDADQIFLPHIVFGIGYPIRISPQNQLFIEWDFGIKPSLSNINIGFSF